MWLKKTLGKLCHIVYVPHGCHKGISSKGTGAPHKLICVHVTTPRSHDRIMTHKTTIKILMLRLIIDG